MSSNQPVSRLTDQEYLRKEQYADAANLRARLQLHQRFSTNPYNWFLWIFDHLDLPDSEIYRVLKPNACLYADTNGITHLQELYELINQFEPSIKSSSQILPFNLENGREPLRRWFPEVEMDVYEDSLRVTEAEPLCAYILSMMTVDSNREQEARLHQFIASELKRQGVIHISKKPGLFISKKC